MKWLKHSVLFISFAILTFSCSNNERNEQKNAINKLEKELYNSETFDKNQGLQMVELCSNFANKFPADSLAPKYLYKAAEISMNLQLSQKSIDYYTQILEQYPTFNKAPECVFLQAFVYENQLQNIPKAGELYSLFISKYPEHPLAKDAQASIRFLGKSPEELIQIFQEMNKE